MEVKYGFDEKEREFEKYVITQYLRYGSVDEVFRANKYDLPISYAGVCRLIDKWGVVKAAGPNTSLSQCLGFLVKLVEEKIPLETLYKKMPTNFTPSVATLHRIYKDVKEQVKEKIEERTPRRNGVALIISPKNAPHLVLVGRDVSTPRLDLGKKYGAVSLPMGFARRTQRRYESILRILQQEVFTKLAISQNMPDIIPKSPEPFLYIDVADIRVAVYRLVVKNTSLSFSSYKLVEHKYIDINGNSSQMTNLRAGVLEALDGYRDYLTKQKSPVFVSSYLNLALRSL